MSMQHPMRTYVGALDFSDDWRFQLIALYCNPHQPLASLRLLLPPCPNLTWQNVFFRQSGETGRITTTPTNTKQDYR